MSMMLLHLAAIFSRHLEPRRFLTFSFTATTMTAFARLGHGGGRQEDGFGESLLLKTGFGMIVFTFKWLDWVRLNAIGV